MGVSEVASLLGTRSWTCETSGQGTCRQGPQLKPLPGETWAQTRAEQTLDVLLVLRRPPLTSSNLRAWSPGRRLCHFRKNRDDHT